MEAETVFQAASPLWVLVASALVLLMTPGVAFFYAGMTRAKSTLNMMMMSFAAMAIGAVVWVLWGYSMTAGSGVLQLFGNPSEFFGLTALLGGGDLITAGFGATFAIITVAIISGAIADRTKFAAWLVFVPIWLTLVYFPMAYMVWGGGLLGEDGLIGSRVGEAVDFAGGTVVHINAGIAALVLALIIGRRQGFGADATHRPHSLPLVMLGAAILWFGWFGFNAGAAGSAAEAGLILVTTMAAPAAALLGWLAVEWLRDGRPTSLGAASGVVAGLVAITPACANVSPLGALAIGLLAGIGSALAVGLKYRFGYDDSLDVVGVHLVSGIIGTVLIGAFAVPLAADSPVGFLYGGGFSLLLTQVVAALVAIVYTAVLTALIGGLIHVTIGFRVSADNEAVGVDLTEHAETAYELADLESGGAFRPHTASSAAERIASAQPGGGLPKAGSSTRAGSTQDESTQEGKVGSR